MKESRLLDKLASALWGDETEREAFRRALLQPSEFGGAVIWLREPPIRRPFEILPPFAWQPAFVDRVSPQARPGASEAHAAGEIYCLDTSSVLAASILGELPAEEWRVLDLCSSPGGKAIFAARLLRPAQLVCNEVIGKRVPALISNLKRCAIANARVTSRDSEFFAARAPAGFELVMVDAPCSGQSLLAKGDRAPGALHPATINMNSNRQKRILANAAAAVRPGGYLAYMTCTYSREENEAVVNWLLKRFPAFRPLEAERLAEFRSGLAEFPAYRVWPHRGVGAGAFAVLLRNGEEWGAAGSDPGELGWVWRYGEGRQE